MVKLHTNEELLQQYNDELTRIVSIRSNAPSFIEPDNVKSLDRQIVEKYQMIRQYESETMERPRNRSEYRALLDTLHSELNMLRSQREVEHQMAWENYLNVSNGLRAEAREDQSSKLDAIRVIRDRLLAETDFTQLVDAPITDEEKQVWATYRQELRDFTTTVNLDDIQFPSPQIVEIETETEQSED